MWSLQRKAIVALQIENGSKCKLLTRSILYVVRVQAM